MIKVGNPCKVGEGVQSYYVYSVTSDIFRTSEVQRRYSDFVWLHDSLTKQCRGFIIPPLPGKAVGLLQGPEFLEQRRKGLVAFLQRIHEHADLKITPSFRQFLECTVAELTELKNSSAQSTTKTVNDKKKALNSWFGKTYQRFSENDKVKLLASKAGKDIAPRKSHVDLEFDILSSYISGFLSKVKALESKVLAIQRDSQSLALNFADFSDLIEDLGKYELNNAKNGKCSGFGALNAVSIARARQCASEMDSLVDSICDLARYTMAAQNAIKVREDHRFSYQAASSNMNKVMNQEGSNNSQNASAEERFSTSKTAFEEVHNRVVGEINRFREEKDHLLQDLIINFLNLQIKLNSENSKQLNSSMSLIEKPKVSDCKIKDANLNSFSLDLDDDVKSFSLSLSDGKEDSIRSEDLSNSIQLNKPYADVCL